MSSRASALAGRTLSIFPIRVCGCVCELSSFCCRRCGLMRAAQVQDHWIKTKKSAGKKATKPKKTIQKAAKKLPAKKAPAKKAPAKKPPAKKKK